MISISPTIVHLSIYSNSHTQTKGINLKGCKDLDVLRSLNSTCKGWGYDLRPKTYTSNDDHTVKKVPESQFLRLFVYTHGLFGTYMCISIYKDIRCSTLI